MPRVFSLIKAQANTRTWARIGKAVLVIAGVLSLGSVAVGCAEQAATGVLPDVPDISHGYGVPDHGPDYPEEGIHPGVDYELPEGTPILAASDGRVVIVRAKYTEEGPIEGLRGETIFVPKTMREIEGKTEPDSFGGYYVILRHDDVFLSFYHHLSKFTVDKGDVVKRGQVIGYSGRGVGRNVTHLHFGVFRFGGSPRLHSQTYNPAVLWLDEKPQCFDPKRDYSKVSLRDLTHPVACGDFEAVPDKTRIATTPAPTPAPVAGDKAGQSWVVGWMAPKPGLKLHYNRTPGLAAIYEVMAVDGMKISQQFLGWRAKNFHAGLECTSFAGLIKWCEGDARKHVFDETEVAAAMWPMKVGNTVTFKTRRSRWSWTMSLTVEGVEDVSVGAGSFKAFVIRTKAVGLDGTPYQGHGVIWYVPELGDAARGRWEVTGGRRAGSRYFWELEEIERPTS